MSKIFKKSKKAIREGGVSLLLKRGVSVTRTKVEWATAWFMCPFFIGKAGKFHTDNSKDVLDFIQSSSLGYLIRPAQVRSEILALLDIFKSKAPKVVMEIGTAMGGTLFCFSKLAPEDAIIISLDLPGGTFGGGYPKGKIPLFHSFKKKWQKIFLLREDSHLEQTVKKVEKVLQEEKINFLFIDGDHTYEGVKRDFELYSPLVENGGIVAFHDIAAHPEDVGCSVDVFWHEIKGKYRYNEFIDDKNQGWAGIGVLFL